jgi:hypothetical protein
MRGFVYRSQQRKFLAGGRSGCHFVFRMMAELGHERVSIRWQPKKKRFRVGSGQVMMMIEEPERMINERVNPEDQLCA